MLQVVFGIQLIMVQLFLPILDSSNTQNVGDIAVDWKTKTIWVGTGENNSSRSSVMPE